MCDVIKTVALRPSGCDDKAIADFMALLLAGGEVVQEGLEKRIRSAVRLVFLSVGGCLSGIAALKRPEQGYRKHVSSRAGFPLPEAEYTFELGWVFVIPSARGRGFSLDLTRTAMSAAGTSGVFATSRTDNDRMHASLAKLRLHDLVRAYSIQLRGHLHESEAKEYQAFKDTNSFEVYKAIHALFWELAALRDTLAEFAAVFCFSQVGVRTMSGLRKSLDKNPPADPLADEILRSTDQSSGGWLATFTNYRNFFTHVAPMEQAANIAFAVQDMRDLSGGFSIPQIYYPLPPDIEDLTRKRSQGTFFNSLEELSAASSRRHQRTSEPDALDYLHGCLNQFAELALMLVARSPIVPEPIHIDPEDIIGGIKVT